MKKIRLITYPQSLAQADHLLDYADVLVFGEPGLAVRLPAAFSRTEQASLVALAHERGKKAVIAVNGLLHNAAIEAFQAYLPQLVAMQVDAIQTGDPGVIQVMREAALNIPVIWDTQTLNTSSGHLNFWAQQGAVGAVLSTELPQAELAALVPRLKLPAIIQVYGAVGLHHSRRPFVSNYAEHFGQASGKLQVGDKLKASSDKPLYLSEPACPEAKYPLNEDESGAHIFAAEDLNLISVLDQLVGLGLYNWSLASLFQTEETYVKIAGLYWQAARALEEGQWTRDLGESLKQQVRDLHPAQRPLGLGFFPWNPEDIK